MIRPSQTLQTITGIVAAATGLIFYKSDSVFPIFDAAFNLNALVAGIAGVCLVACFYFVLSLGADGRMLADLMAGQFNRPSRESYSRSRLLLGPILARLHDKKPSFPADFQQNILAAVRLRFQARLSMLGFGVRILLFTGLLATLYLVSQNLTPDSTITTLQGSFGPVMFAVGCAVLISILHMQIARLYSHFLADLTTWFADPLGEVMATNAGRPRKSGAKQEPTL